MELVYLWVEEYKNIHRQGFNFSPRFTCDYDEDSNELTIDKNDDYIENFFGENINVTAIVGKNGSGKSSILEIFEKLVVFSQIDIKTNYLLIYNIENELRYFSNIKFKSNFFKKGAVDFNGFMSFVSQLPYPMYHRKKYHPESITYDSQYELYKTVTFEEQKIAKMIAYTFRNEISIKNNLFDFSPITLKINAINELEELPFFEDEVKKLYIDKTNIDKKEKHSNRGLGDILKDVEDAYENDLVEFSTEAKLMDPEPEDIFENYLKNLVIINQLQDIFLKSTYMLEFNDTSNNIVKLNEFLQENKLSKLAYKCNFQTFKSLINKEVNIKDLDENDIEVYFDIYYELLSFDFIDKRNRHLYDLSHGEKTIFSLLLNLILKVESSENNIFIFDELEISLHPNWQKKILSELIRSLSKLGNNIHLVLITHSPFLLSDIPKQNIVFLDTYKKEDKDVKSERQKVGNCKVLSHDKVLIKKETFGANIHTLLSDSFFMDDGLMGEFAKGKINDVYNFIVHHKTGKIKTKEDAQAIIDIIGEPLIQRELQQLFDKKFELSDMKIDDEISLLERKLQALKKIKNDTN